MNICSHNETAAKEYLYLPLRLFIAISYGSSDPLISGGTTECGIQGPEDYQQARKAVAHNEWDSKGIISSEDYLKRLFEDDGSVIKVLEHEAAYLSKEETRRGRPRKRDQKETPSVNRVEMQERGDLCLKKNSQAMN